MGKQNPQPVAGGKHQDQVRMTAKEYRIMMGLDPTEGKVTAVVEETTEVEGIDLSSGPKRVFFRLLWLVGWIWMIFTFGWIGHVITVLAKKGLRE